MRPVNYFDIRVGADAGARTHIPGSAGDMLAHALRIVHGTSKAKSVRFASAFPGAHMARGVQGAHPGDVLRIFAASLDEARMLHSEVACARIIASCANVSPVQYLQAGFDAAQRSYELVRTPTVRSAQRCTTRGRDGDAAEAAAIAQKGLARRYAALERNNRFPFLRMRSSNTGQSFSLRFEIREATQMMTTDPSASPNSWGLGTRAVPVWLPPQPQDYAPPVRTRRAAALEAV